jgi:hypothetical protein
MSNNKNISILISNIVQLTFFSKSVNIALVANAGFVFRCLHDNDVNIRQGRCSCIVWDGCRLTAVVDYLNRRRNWMRD